MNAWPQQCLIVGADGGIGAAIGRSLPCTCDVVRLSRRNGGPDIANEKDVAASAATFSGRRFDLIFVASGALMAVAPRPDRSFFELDPLEMAALFAVNAVGPALVFKHFGPLIQPDRRAVFAVLSARLGSIGDNRLGGWTAYRASKAALNQILRSAALELKRRAPEAVALALHPGTIETRLTRPFANGKYTASPDECAKDLLAICETAAPHMSGGFFAYDGSMIPW